MDVRLAEEGEIGHLAGLWHDGWQDAHAEIVPKELARLRTRSSFEDRLRAILPNVRVVGLAAHPLDSASSRATSSISSTSPRNHVALGWSR